MPKKQIESYEWLNIGSMPKTVKLGPQVGSLKISKNLFPIQEFDINLFSILQEDWFESSEWLNIGIRLTISNLVEE